MDNQLFESLLHEEESATLDFKEMQYRFVKATEEEKSELLKDILGFVNGWRCSEAYILVGVKDIRGGRSIVVGIPPSDHLDDHALQQFVNNLTNRPVRFCYEAFGVEGKQVGILRIEEQPRPVYLKRDYGRLKKSHVYVRRGSSTDPTKPAAPDEIALMGNGLLSSSSLGEVKAFFHTLLVDAHRLNDCNTPDRESWADEVKKHIENALIGQKLFLFTRDYSQTFQGVRQWLFSDSQNLKNDQLNPKFRIPDIKIP